jgi:outer membrane protein
MNLKKLLLFGMAVGWASYITIAQDTAQVMRFSLAEAQAYAIANNYSVISATKDVEIAKKTNWEYTSIGLPQVSATGNYQNTFSVPTLSFPVTTITNTRQDGTYSGTVIGGDSVFLTMVPGEEVELGTSQTYSLDLAIEQLVFSGQYLVGLQAAKMLTIKSEQQLVVSEMNTKELVANLYYASVILKEVVKAYDDNLKINQQILDEVTKLYAEGLRAETEVDQFKINVSRLENAKELYQFRLESSIRALKLTLGKNVLDPIVLTDSINFFIERDLVSFLSNINFDINNNIDYQLIETVEKLQVLNLKNEKVQYLPSVYAFYNHQWLLDQPDISFSYPDMIGVSMNIPIFNSGQKWAKVGKAKFNLEKTQNEKTAFSESLIADYETAKEQYITALNNYTTLIKIVELSKKVFDNTTIQYKEGVASSLDVNQVQYEYLQNLGNYYEAVIGLLSAKSHLDRLMMLI